VGPSKARKITVSFTIRGTFLLGGGAVPAGIGVLADSGFLFLGFILVGGLIMSGLFLLHFLKFWDE
jgi:hypothetical protein